MIPYRECFKKVDERERGEKIKKYNNISTRWIVLNLTVSQALYRLQAIIDIFEEGLQQIRITGMLLLVARLFVPKRLDGDWSAALHAG